MTTLTLTAMALVGIGAVRAIAARSIPARRAAVRHTDEPPGRDARPCAAARRHRPRHRVREGRRSPCR
jgi:hypothetical protein